MGRGGKGEGCVFRCFFFVSFFFFFVLFVCVWFGCGLGGQKQ